MSKRGLASLSEDAPRRALRRRAGQLGRQRRSGAWCRSSRSTRTPTSPGRSWATCPSSMASIAEKGIIEPLVVRQRGSRYQIVAGERRYQAAVQVGPARAAGGHPRRRRHRDHRGRAGREHPAQGPGPVRGGRGDGEPRRAVRLHARGPGQAAGEVADVDHRVAGAGRDARRGPKSLSAGRHFL